MGFFSGSTEDVAPQFPVASAEETAAFTGATSAFTGAAGDIDRQRAFEQSTLGLQSGVTGTSRQLQDLILQNLIKTFSPEGLAGQAGLVGQAFQEPFRQQEEALIGQFQSQGFNPFGTTSGAQALGQFGASKASAIAQALLQNLQFSSELGLQRVDPSVPTAPIRNLASPFFGTQLGQAQTQLGSTLGNIRAATFRPEILSQGPRAPGVFGGVGAALGGIAGGIIGIPLGPAGIAAGAAVGAGAGGAGGAALGSALSRG